MTDLKKLCETFATDGKVADCGCGPVHSKDCVRLSPSSQYIKRALLDDLPAQIPNPESWPPNYAEGYNDAVRRMEEVIASIGSSGYAVVPREPTPEMLEAGAIEDAMNMQRVQTATYAARCIYRAMVNVATRGAPP